MKKSYHLKTSTLYFLTAENPKELFGKLYPRRIEATEYRLMEMECEDYQEVIGEYDDDHNYWEIIDEVNEGVEFDGHWLAGFEAVSSMFELAGYEQVDISEEGYEEFDDIDISKLELEKIRANVVNNQLLKDAVQEWLDNPASSEKKYGHISNWDTSKVTSMEELFRKAEAFNQPLDKWDVSNVTNMSAMFAETKLFNQPLDKWDVSNVTDMSEMFAGTESFNQPIGDWNVGNVTDMDNMFAGTESFNQPLDKWDVSNVIYMEDMFYKALAFSQDTSSWGTNEPNNENTGFTLENPHIHSICKMRSARSKMEAGNYNEALKEILESIEIISNSINNDTAAMIYFHMQNFEKGLEYSNESIKMNGTYSLNFYNRAQILVKLDKIDLAIKDLKKAIASDGFEDAKKLLEQIT
jgi:surface protein